MKKLILSEKWRPKNIDDIIILPRIKKIFESGITQNYILYGHYGTGKTSITRILIGKYSKSNPYLEINASKENSIDIVRGKIEDFCSTVFMGLDSMEYNSNSMKYVFLDEFERMSAQAQDSLKVFIEEYNTKNVRFILNTNHINKVSDGIKSRMTKVNFDCLNSDEEKYLKTEIYKRIKNIICVDEDIDISKDQLVKIITRKFPDIRSILIELQNFKETGSIDDSVNVNNNIKSQLYELVYNKSIGYEEIYHFLMNNFGADKIDEVISLFSSSFINHSLNEKRQNIDKLFEVNYIIADNAKLLETATDPIIIGMTVIGKIRDLF